MTVYLQYASACLHSPFIYLSWICSGFLNYTCGYKCISIFLSSFKLDLWNCNWSVWGFVSIVLYHVITYFLSNYTKITFFHLLPYFL